MAAAGWTDADRLDRQAQQAFDSGDVAGALQGWQAARAGYEKAQQAAGEIENSIGMRLVRILPGTFSMGSPDGEDGREDHEGPKHSVQVSKTFYLGKYEVTQEQYQQVMGKNPSYFAPIGKGWVLVGDQDTRNFPVDSVPWKDAVAFCRALSERPEEQAAGRKYDLPTEAEWEYACRAGTTSPFHFGAQLNGTQANCDGTNPHGAGKGPYLERTCPVGSYPPNAWGLYDMHGNVWEWCKDWYKKDYYKSGEDKDPQGPAMGDPRVLRGGSWSSSARFCRAAGRLWYVPKAQCLGFRVALRVE
jgi:formylglycine-generating enzyme required for sulfatase activity